MPSFEEIRDRLDTPVSVALRTPGPLVRLLPDPVDDDTLLACLDLAVAANAGQRRPCEFVVLRDPDLKHQLARIYRQGWSIYRRILRGRGDRLLDLRQWEADHLEDVPVLVVACARGLRPPFPAFSTARWYASVMPAVQNLLVAAHALGLGATLTTLPVWEGWEARRTLGLPWRVSPVAVVPLGWPRDPVEPPAPPHVGEMVHLDRFGNRPFRGRKPPTAR